MLLCQLTNLEELELGLLQPLSVAAVHHEDDTVCAAGVGPPERPRLVLAADVPKKKIVGFASTVRTDANLK